MPGIRPRLIHPVLVTIEPLDPAHTTFDAMAREQVPALVRKAPVSMLAQVHWARLQDVEDTPTGNVERYDGYLVFRRDDLTAAGYTPADGDRVVAIEGVTKKLYLNPNAQQRGQYQQQHHLVRVFFRDRGARRD